MTNHFDSGGGDQNTAQGDHAIGRQENVTQEVRGDGCISSGTGNVTVNQSVLLKPRTVLLASALAAAVFGGGLAAWHWLAPVQTNSIVIKDNKQSGPTAVAQGAGAAVNQTNISGVPPEVFAQYVKELGATEQVVNGFFGTLLQEKVPRDQWDSKLREIAAQYKELLQRLEAVQSEDPVVLRLKKEAKQAIEAGAYAKAEELLKEADVRDVQAFEQLETAAKRDMEAARQRRISAAETNAAQARLHRVQLRYAKAAESYRKAAALLPEEWKQERSLYLNKAEGYDLYQAGRYTEALPLYEQSLNISQEIGSWEEEIATLSNIIAVYLAQGNYNQALNHIEQCLAISREIGDRAWEADTNWNIGDIYVRQGDLRKAEPYMSRAVQLAEEIGHPSLEKWRKTLERIRAKLRGR